MAQKDGEKNRWESESKLDLALLDSLGLGLEPTTMYLFQVSSSFTMFEEWIQTQTNLDDRAEMISRFNALFDNKEKVSKTNFDYLAKEDLAFFEKEGFIILRNAISKNDCEDTVELITRYLDVDLQNPETWYSPHTLRQGIMIQLFRHNLLERNRQSIKIRQAYECLWKEKNLWVSTDRVGFNPPETDNWKFPGPHMHLDVKPQNPLPFGLQGILYLTDTDESQGALTLIPGFHKKINSWMQQKTADQIVLPEAFDDFEKKPVSANAGDFIIWHHGLPHGGSANTHTNPRIVQYINWYPVFQ